MAEFKHAGVRETHTVIWHLPRGGWKQPVSIRDAPPAGQARSHPHPRHQSSGSRPWQLHRAVAQLKFPHPGSRPVLPSVLLSDDLEGMKPPSPECTAQAASFSLEALRLWKTGLQGSHLCRGALSTVCHRLESKAVICSKGTHLLRRVPRTRVPLRVLLVGPATYNHQVSPLVH